jgi:Fur family ferric uptake transcriptional regulator
MILDWESWPADSLLRGLVPATREKSVELQAVPVSQSPVDKFREYLASRPRPQRFTDQQRDMVEFIFKQHEHFDAEQLIDELKLNGLQISRATVYRTLTKLVDAGLLRRLELGPRTYYEHDYGYPHHYHMQCEKCGEMIEFQSPVIEAALQEVCRQQSFHAGGHTVLIRGLCAECNRARVTKRRLDLI